MSKVLPPSSTDAKRLSDSKESAASDLADQAHPVKIGPGRVLVQAGEGLELLLRPPVACDEAADDVGCLGKLLAQRRGIADEGVDPRLVGPAEHILPSVAYPLPVVLLVAVTVLDLASAGQCLLRFAEVGDVFHARMIGLACELAFQPCLESRAGFHLEHVDQERVHRLAVGWGRGRGAGRHPEVDDPGAQMVVVDPPGDRLVLAIGNEQRQREAVEDGPEHHLAEQLEDGVQA